MREHSKSEHKKHPREILRIVKFTSVSVSSAFIYVFLFTLFYENFKEHYWLGYVLSLCLAIAWDFSLNRRFTFISQNRLPRAICLMALYYAVFIPLSAYVGELLNERGVNGYLILILSFLLHLALEFLYTRCVVYVNDCDTRVKSCEKPLLYRLVFGTVKLFYRKRKVLGLENLKESDQIIITNHAQMHGPLYAELYFPKKKRTWCIGKVMSVKEFPDYAYSDFWGNKSKWTRWFFKLSSYAAAPLASYIFKNADTIPVYKDGRIISTFKSTVQALSEGNNVIIFPEDREKYNHIVNDFQDKFIDVAKLYYKKYGKKVSFVPAYIAPKIKTVIYGKPIEFDPEMDMDEQRKLICDYLKNEITALAISLPKHKVIPYDNVKKKAYPYSKEEE